jgi:hypothetical protein
MQLRRTICFGLTLLLCGAAAAHDSPESMHLWTAVSKIPLESCTPIRALSVDYTASVIREGDLARRAIFLLDRMKKINALATNPHEPIGKQLTRTQIAQFEDIRAQLVTNQLASLAESRRQRDDNLMSAAAELLSGKPFSQKNTLANGATLLAALGTFSHLPKSAMQAPRDTEECSIGLAFFNAERSALDQGSKLLKSHKWKMYVKLRHKYKIKNGTALDPKQLPSPDKQEASWLKRALLLPLKRDFFAVGAWYKLRLYARVDRLEYDLLRHAILIGGGPKTYSEMAKKAFVSASPRIKSTIKVWNAIDEMFEPSDIRALKQARKLEKDVDR